MDRRDDGAAKRLRFTLADLAAVYCHGIAEGQAFLDGNKRAAVLAADTFLRINGYHLELSADEGVRLMVGLATGELTRDDLARAFAVATSTASSSPATPFPSPRREIARGTRAFPTVRRRPQGGTSGSCDYDHMPRAELLRWLSEAMGVPTASIRPIT